jgi:hypothetical protein
MCGVREAGEARLTMLAKGARVGVACLLNKI